jgi:PTS system glucitol/sorbitol-specific IIA component
MTETIRYSTTVTSVGSLVPDFIGQGMLIIFGDGAPPELHDLCALHTPDVKDGGVRAGDRLRLDDQEFTILSVGDVANANLTALGHVSFKANGATTAQLPGDISVEERPLPLLREGSRVVIVAGDQPS